MTSKEEVKKTPLDGHHPEVESCHYPHLANGFDLKEI